MNSLCELVRAAREEAGVIALTETPDGRATAREEHKRDEDGDAAEVEQENPRRAEGPLSREFQRLRET